MLLSLTPLMLISFGSAYAISDYAVVSEDVTIIVENGTFESAFIGSHEVVKEDIIRYRDYGNNDIRVFAETITGEYVYMLYGGSTVHVILFAEDKQRFTQDSSIVPLF